MNYQEAIEYLYNLRLSGMKLGLENTLKLAERAGNPQEKLQFIHVAGTNGKGSTCAMLESMYRTAGLRVGLFTSPHLVSFAERIQMNRRLIPQEDVARGVARLRDVAAGMRMSPTFFEMVTILALQYFAEQDCDLVVWETGLGGRLDATNIVTPLASVITNVQLEHQQWLGDTLEEIAAEKAGIIKPNVPVVTGAAETAALGVIERIARERNAPLTIVTSGETARRFEIGLAGAHQRINAAVALAVVRALAGRIPVPETAIPEGLKHVRWDGRLQPVRRGGQTVLLDSAHNPGGAETLAAALRTDYAGQTPTLILGTMADKDYTGICRILAPLAGKIFVLPFGSEPNLDPRLLYEACHAANRSARVAVCGGLAEALEQSAGDPFVVVTGSIYFVGETMGLLHVSDLPDEKALNEYGGKEAQVRAVTFDMGGTLIEPWPSVGSVYAEVAARHGVRVAGEVLDRRFAEAWKARKNFGHRRSDWEELVDATFAGLTPRPPSATFFPEIYGRFSVAEAWRIFDDVRPCLQSLRQRGFKIGVISNWDERLRPLLRALDLERYFDVIFVSAEFGKPKPDADIFRAAAEQLGVPAAAILHVGDSAVEDVEGARRAGFQAALLRRNGSAGREGIASLAALPLR